MFRNYRPIDRLLGRRYSRGQSKEAFKFPIRIIAKRLTPQQMAERRIRGETESCNLLSNGKPLGQIVAITQF